MSASSPTAWAVWLILSLFLISCIGIIIWFAYAYNVPTREEGPTYQVA